MLTIRRGIAAFLVLLCLMPVAAHAFGGGMAATTTGEEQTGLESVTLTQKSNTSVSVTWNDPGVSMKVSYAVAGHPVQWSLTSTGPVQLSGLAPNTTYEVTVYDEKNDITKTEMIALAEPEPYRGNGFRWNLCNPYYVVNGSKPLFDRSRRRVNNETLADFTAKRNDGGYYIILEASWKKTEADKTWREVWVMRTPSGNVFTWEDFNICEADWTGFYFAYPIDKMLLQYMADDDRSIEIGTYQFELYFDGLFAGRTTLTIK